MARLPYLDESGLAPQDRDLLERNINLVRLLAHSPGTARCAQATAMHIRHRSKLDPRLRELAILQVGFSTRSAYEFAHHLKIGREFGVSGGDIGALYEESAGRPSSLDPLASAVLRAAREITLEARLTDETFDALREALDSERLVELIFTITVYNGTARLLAAMRVEVEDDYRALLDEFPLPSD